MTELPTKEQVDAFRAWYQQHTGKRIYESNARKALESVLTLTPQDGRLENYEDILRTVCHHLELPQTESGPADDPLLYERALVSLLAELKSTEAERVLHKEARHIAEAKLAAGPIDAVLDAAAAHLVAQYGKSYGLDHPVDRARIKTALDSQKTNPSEPCGAFDPQTITLVWKKIDSGAREHWRAEFKDYVADVVHGHDNMWSYRVNNRGNLGYASGDEAKTQALAALKDRLSTRLETARETVALYDAIRAETPPSEASFKASQAPWSDAKQAVWRLIWNNYNESSDQAAKITDLIFEIIENARPAIESLDVVDAGARLRDIVARHAGRSKSSLAHVLAQSDVTADAFWDAIAFDLLTSAGRRPSKAVIEVAPSVGNGNWVVKVNGLGVEVYAELDDANNTATYLKRALWS